MGGVPVSFVCGSVFFVVADQDQSWHSDLLQSIRVIMFLARQHEVKIILQWRNTGHPDLEKPLDQLGMSRYEFFGPAGFNGVLANVALEAHADHVAAHDERNALRSRMRGTAGREDEFFHPPRIIKCQELC